MKPIHFKQSNASQPKPMEIGETVQQYIPTYQDVDQVASCWTASLWQRLKFLFHGRVWVVFPGSEQPPFWMACKKNIINTKK